MPRVSEFGVLISFLNESVTWVQSNLILFLVLLLPLIAASELILSYFLNKRMMKKSPEDASESESFRSVAIATFGFSITLLSLILTQNRVDELSRFLPLIALSVTFCLVSLQSMTWANKYRIMLKVQGRSLFWSITTLYLLLVLLTAEFSGLAAWVLGVGVLPYILTRCYKVYRENKIYWKYS